MRGDRAQKANQRSFLLLTLRMIRNNSPSIPKGKPIMQKQTAQNLPKFLAFSCVGFIATAPAMAADALDEGDSGDNGDPIIVTGQLPADQAPKAVAPLIDTPRSVVVVDKQVIKETGSATLVEALRTVPGITFGAAEGGNPIGDRPFIRGFDSQGSTYLDGVRDIGAQSREVFAVEQIQIVRGSDSTLGGRGSAGGSLNIISKLPERENFVAGSISAGTADYKRITADVNYVLGSNIALRVTGMWHDQDVAGRDAIWQKRWGIAPSLKLGVRGPTSLTLSYYHLDTDELPDSGIPYLYTIANAPTGYSYSEPAIGNVTLINGATGYVSRRNFYGLKSRDFRNSKTDQATMRFDHDFGNGIKLRNTSRYSHTDQSYIFLLPDDSQGNVFGTATANPTTGAAGARGDILTGGYVWTRANTRYGYTNSIINQTDLYGRFNTGTNIEHSFALGAELSWEKARRGTFVTRGFVNSSGNEILSAGATVSPRCNSATIARYYCVSLFAPNPDAPWVNYASDTSNVVAPIIKSLPIAETRNDANTQSVYAFDSISIGKSLIVNLGARYDSFASKVTPGQPISATTTFSLARRDNVFNWQAGLIFKPSGNSSLYASYATAATPPNSLLGEGQEQNSPGTANNQAAVDALKVERTRSIEVGAKADLFDSRLSLNLALFQTETKNARATSDLGAVAFIGERKIKGVEFGFNGTILPGWTAFGGYTYMDAEIVNGGFTALTVAAVGGQPAKTVLVPSVNTGRQFPQTARHSFTIWSNAEILPGLTLGGGAFYTSRVFGGYQDNRSATQDATGAVTINPATRIVARTIPGYWRFDARVGYRINEHLDLSVNIQNLTDKVYFNQAYTSHYASIAPGRSAIATLNFKY